jgi:hypothetical protein
MTSMMGSSERDTFLGALTGSCTAESAGCHVYDPLGSNPLLNMTRGTRMIS